MDIIKEDNSKLNTLFTYLGIFAGIWVVLIKILMYLLEKRADTDSISYAPNLIIVSLISYIFILYVFYAIKAIYYHTAFEHVEGVLESKLESKKLYSYNKIVHSWIALIFYSLTIILLISSYPIFQSLFPNHYVLISSLVTAAVIFVYIFYFHVWAIEPYIDYQHNLVYPYENLIHCIKETVSTTKDFLLNPSFRKIKTFWKFLVNTTSDYKKIIHITFFQLVLPILFFIIYFLILLSVTSSVGIYFDKNAYYPDEDIRVEIRPMGIIIPTIQRVVYANDYTLYDKENQPYIWSKRFLVINSTKIKTDTPNSHVRVDYTYFNTSSIYFSTLGDRVIKNVPIFKRESPEKPLNLTINQKLRINLSIEVNNSTVNYKNLIVG